MNAKLSVVLLGVIILGLVGCGENQASRNTASAVLESIFKKSASNAAELKALQAMPEYKVTLDCMASSLSGNGWDADKHNEFMKLTNGDIAKLDSSQFSEAEAIEKFGAISLASADCM